MQAYAVAILSFLLLLLLLLLQVFDEELQQLEALVRQLAAAGVDAVIVQVRKAVKCATNGSVLAESQLPCCRHICCKHMLPKHLVGRGGIYQSVFPITLLACKRIP
jgi:hypothetical protein